MVAAAGRHGLKSTSLVFRTDPPILSEALFVEVDEDGEARSPEVFPRGDRTTYVCGYRSHEPLPVDPAQVAPGPGTAEALLALTRRFSPALADAESSRPRPATGRSRRTACR